MVAVRQAALVSDESALEACLQRCAVQIDDLYLYFFTFVVGWKISHGEVAIFNPQISSGILECSKFLTEEIMAAQNFNFAPKFFQNGVFNHDV